MKTRLLTFLAILIAGTASLFGQVAINNDGTLPNSSAMLDIKSDTAGILIPRMTAVQRDAINSPAQGLMVYVTDDNAFYYFDNSSWQAIGNGASSLWGLNGNTVSVEPSQSVAVGKNSTSGKFEVSTIVPTGAYSSDLCSGGVVSAQEHGGSYVPEHLFDDNNVSLWRNDNTLPVWIQYDFGAGNEKAIQKYRILWQGANFDFTPFSWDFLASDDEATWTTIDSQTAQSDWASGEWKEFTFTNQQAYRYYRLKITDNNGVGNTGVYLNEMEMMEEVYSEYPAFFVEGDKVGVGTASPTANLEVNGILKYVDGNEGNGKVLSSDANGNAIWLDATSLGLTDADFFAEGTSLPPSGINDDIYTMGNVAIGKNLANYPVDIQSDSARRGVSIFLNENTNNTIGGVYNDLTNTGTGSQYGVANNLEGSSGGDQHGTINTITNSGTGTHYGVENILTGVNNGDHLGVLNFLSGNGQGKQYGVKNDIFNGNDNQQYGEYSVIYGNGNGTHFGNYNRLLGSGGGMQIGVYDSIYNSGDGNHYGTKSILNGSGSGIHYGAYHHLLGNGDGDQYGVYDSIYNNGNGLHYGSYNVLNGSGTGPHIGSHSILTGNGDGPQTGFSMEIANAGDGNHYGLFSHILGDGSGDHYGAYQSLSGNGNGKNYGTYNNLWGTGSGDKYGTYNKIASISGGTHYAVYGEAQKTGSYAGYFKGEVSTSMDYNYATPKVYKYQMTGYCFTIGEWYNIDIMRQDTYIKINTDDEGEVIVKHEVHLPKGAVVIKMEAWVAGHLSGSNHHYFLLELVKNDSVLSTISNPINSADIVVMTNTTINDPVIDDDDIYYVLLHVHLTDNDDFAIHRVTIEYTLDHVSQ